jgi:hypothetical protein
VSSLQDLYCLPDLLISRLKILGGKKYRHFVSVLKTEAVQSLITKTFCLPSGGKFRKISYFPDKEDKVRVIGILDYFSQEALYPLHKWLYRALARIPQDCTFNQGSFKTSLEGRKVYYSIDLTAATDRFPISTISKVLRGVLPQYYVDAWHHVIVGYPFDYNGQEISYSVGNPMGAYSS